MSERFTRVLWLLWLCGCVLPDYTVVSESKAPDRSSDGGTSSEPADTQDAATANDEKGSLLLAEAPDECERCVEASCKTERQDCGEDCDELSWPVSPVWHVEDAADPFVRCLSQQCGDSCNVDWGCVKRYVWPEPHEAYSFTLRVTDAIRDIEVEGIRVTACQGRDPSCSEAIGLISSAVTNSLGRAVLTLNDEFFGYFLLEPEEKNTQEGEEDYLSMTVMWSQPYYRTESVLTASLFKPSWIKSIASAAEDVQDGKGHLLFKAQNCLPQRYTSNPEANANADGVSVSYSALSPGSGVYYAGAALTLNLTASATSPEGLSFGGAFNLPPGPVTVTAVHDDTEVSSVGFPLRADTMAALFLVPRARN